MLGNPDADAAGDVLAGTPTPRVDELEQRQATLRAPHVRLRIVEHDLLLVDPDDDPKMTDGLVLMPLLAGDQRYLGGFDEVADLSHEPKRKWIDAPPVGPEPT